MPDRIRVGVEFEVEPDKELLARGFESPYRDTIWWDEESYGGSLTASVLQRMRAGADTKTNTAKALRFANWKHDVLNPPAPEPEPEVDMTSAARSAVARAQEALDAANAALSATVELAEEVTPEG